MLCMIIINFTNNTIIVITLTVITLMELYNTTRMFVDLIIAIYIV